MEKPIFSSFKFFVLMILFLTLTAFTLNAHAEYYLVYAADIPGAVCCPKYKKVVRKYKKVHKKIAHYKPVKKKCAYYKKYRRANYSSVTVYYPRCYGRTACGYTPPCGSGCGGRDYVTFVGGPTTYAGTFIPYEYYESYDMRTADDDVYRYPDMNWGY